MGNAIAMAIFAFAYLLYWYKNKGYALSTDGAFYQRYATTGRAPSPYSRRWLLPKLLGAEQRNWVVVNAIAFLLTGPLVYLLTESLLCVWLFAFLPWSACNVRFPILVDQVALVFMLSAVVLGKHGYLVPAYVFLAWACACKESTVIYACILWPDPGAILVTLVALGVGVVIGKQRHEPAEGRVGVILANPWKAARRTHDVTHWQLLVGWGAILPLGLYAATQRDWTYFRPALLSLACGYGQVLIAQDLHRQYLWAAPCVLVAIAGAGLPAWWPIVLLQPFLTAFAKGV